MEETRVFIYNTLPTLGPSTDESIRRRIKTLEAKHDPQNALYIRILYTMLDRNTIGCARRAEHVAMFFGALGAILYIVRVSIDGRVSFWSQVSWCVDAACLILYFYETRQCSIILPQVANIVLYVISMISILRHFPDAWSQW